MRLRKLRHAPNSIVGTSRILSWLGFLCLVDTYAKNIFRSLALPFNKSVDSSRHASTYKQFKNFIMFKHSLRSDIYNSELSSKYSSKDKGPIRPKSKA